MSAEQQGAPSNLSLPAIERKDLHALLEKHELLKSFAAGTLLCNSCTSVLTDVNIGAFLVRGGALVPFCNSPECIEEAIKERGK